MLLIQLLVLILPGAAAVWLARRLIRPEPARIPVRARNELRGARKR